jgi:ABC-type antimicrobial peptide transport system permease subunit
LPVSLLVPVRFGLVRIRAHGQRTLVVATGIAVAAAVLAMTAVGSVAVQDRAAQRALGALQPSDRSVQAVWSGVPGQSELSLPQLDRLARSALEPVLGRQPFAVAVFRQATWGGAFVNLGAVDGLTRWVALRSGKLPAPCTPSRCDLIQIGGAPAAPRLPYLHVVGRGVFRSGAPLSAYFAATGGHRPPILVANGVRGFSHLPLPDAGTIARTYGWVVPVAPGSIHSWELPAFGARLDRAQSRLEQATDLFTVSAPTDAIAATRATGRVAGERLLILGGDAAVLLLGFAVLASTRLRRDQFAVRRRLTWFGARRSQILLVAATEVAVITLGATLVGWLLGSAVGAVFARHLDAPGLLAVQHSVLTGRALAIACALALLTGVVMLTALRTDAVAFGGVRVTVVDVAALGALGAVLLALARGKADTTALSSGGTGVVLLLLPGLVLFVLAVAVARLLAPLLRGVERTGRRAPARLRLVLLSLARSPGRFVLSIVFFVLSVGIALFAIAYRGTLERGELEQARYAVPAPYVLQESLEQLVSVQQAAPAARYAALGRTTPALRDSGYVLGNAGRDFTLLALPAAEITRLDGWRSDFAAQTPSELARSIAPAQIPRLSGVALPPDAAHLTVPLDVAGDPLGVALVVLNRRGDFTTLSLGQLGRGPHAPTVVVPRAARGGRLVAVRLSFPVIAAFVAGHKESGTGLSVSDAAVGVLRLGRLHAGNRVLPPLREWVGTGGVRNDKGAVHYLLNRAADSILRPHEPLEGSTVPVIASPAIAGAAGSDGTLPLQVGNRTVLAQVVGVARHFPSIDGQLVVADLPTWLVAANTAEPGTSVPSELWLDAPPAAARQLAQRPFSLLDVTSQRATLAQLRSDPLSRGALALLLVTGIVAAVLAAVGLLLTVVGDLRDESGELYDLEAQGATPRDLRRHVLLRASIVAVLGVVGGIAAGAIVSALVVSVVTVTAGAGVALPPLRLTVDWQLAALALVALAVASGVAILLATRNAYARVSGWRFSEGIE